MIRESDSSGVHHWEKEDDACGWVTSGIEESPPNGIGAADGDDEDDVMWDECSDEESNPAMVPEWAATECLDVLLVLAGDQDLLCTLPSDRLGRNARRSPPATILTASGKQI